MQDRRVIFNMIHEQHPIDEIAENWVFTVQPSIVKSVAIRSRQSLITVHTNTICTIGQRVITQSVPMALHKRGGKSNASSYKGPGSCAMWWPNSKPRGRPSRLRAVWHSIHTPCGHISHETIYQYAYSDQGRADGIPRLLPKARKKRRPRFSRKPRQSFIPDSHRIQARPESVENREEFGHWEGDLMIFRREMAKAISPASSSARPATRSSSKTRTDAHSP